MGKKRNKVEIFKLEDRVLFEAGAVVQAAEAAAADQANNDAAGDGSAAAEMQSDNNQTASNELTPDNLAEMPVPPEMSGSDNADDTADADAADFAAADPESETVAFTDAPIAASETSERILVVLNSSVADADSIVNDLGDNVEVLRLTSGTDALDAINDYLDEHADTKYSAIHLVSHGSEGYITLNGEKIDSTTINPADWKAIGEHLTDDADILVYGCDTAKSDEGKALVQTIANLTGADVAASIDSTGANGDWDLEYRSGLIEAATINPVSYQHDLAASTFIVDGVGTDADDTDSTYYFTNLSSAITKANELGGEIEIKFSVAANTDTNEDGQADAYIEAISSTLNINTSGLNLTINGWSDFDSDGVMDSGEQVILDGGDKYDGTTVTEHSGVQIFNIGSGVTVKLSNMTLQNGFVGGDGGAIYTSGTLTLDGMTFRNNTAGVVTNTIGLGGAIYSNGGTLTIADSLFANNLADGTLTAGHGGGALYLNNSTATISGTTFTGNSGYTGGAIEIAGTGKIGISDSIFTNNVARVWSTWGSGGAINIGYGSATLTISGSLFDGNSAAGGGNYGINGGAIVTRESGQVFIDSSTFINHTNGVFAVRSATAHMTITNSTVINNHANGGVFFQDASDCFTVINSLIGNNTGPGKDFYCSGEGSSSFSQLYNVITTGTSGYWGSGTATATLSGTNLTILSADDFKALFADTAFDADGKVVLTADNTVAIHEKGGAAYEGALVGQLDGVYYCMDGGKWLALDGTEYADFDLTATGYGLGENATIYTTAPNTDVNGDKVDRLYSLKQDPAKEFIQIGAHAFSFVPAEPETPSLTVTTLEDIENNTDGLISLREAIAYAGKLGGAQTISIAAELAFNLDTDGDSTADAYRFDLSNVIDIFAADLVLTIDGANKVVLDGGDKYDGTNVTTHSGTQIFNIGNGVTLKLSNMTVQNSYTVGKGGAIYNSGTLLLDGMTFRNNTAGADASGNTGNGGAIYSNGGTLTIADSLFEDNLADGAKAQQHGGGALFINGGTATISGTTFDGNSGYTGGAIEISGAAAKVGISDSVFTNNVARHWDYYGAGGAINVAAGTLTVSGSLFDGNVTADGNNYGKNAAAIGAFESGKVFIDSSTFINHTNGVFGTRSANTHMTIINSTIINNSISTGLFFQDTNNAYTVINSLIGNSTGTGKDFYCTGAGSSEFSQLYNVIFSGTTGSWTGDSVSLSGTNLTILSADDFNALFETADGKIVMENGIPKISSTGAAAQGGVLVAQLDGAYYYTTGDKWLALDGTEKAAFNATAAGYGLGANATVYTKAQNRIGNEYADRINSSGKIVLGAYVPHEAESLVVTTTQDVADAYDGKTSLREAIANAVNLGGGTITFATDVDWAADTTITVGSTILVNEDLAGDIVIDGSYTYKVTENDVEVAKTGKVNLNASALTERTVILVDTDSTSAASFTFKNMTLTGGADVTEEDGFGQKGAAFWADKLNLTLDGVTVTAYRQLIGSGNSNDFDLAGGAVALDNGTLTILNSTLTNNTTTKPGGGWRAGGAVLVGVNGSLVVDQSTFEGNSVVAPNNGGAGGGAIMMEKGVGDATITDSIFRNNSANAYGGAIFVSGPDRTVTISGSQFTGNSAVKGGGALHSGVKLNVSDTVFRQNTAADGGAVYLAAGVSDFSDVRFEQNSATAAGGAIYNKASGSDMTIVNSDFVNNTAVTRGGAIYNNRHFFIDRSSFIGNTVTGTDANGVGTGAGGAIYTYNHSGIGFVTNSTFYNNSATGTGGAIHFEASGNHTVVPLVNVTIAGNHAGVEGGGVYLYLWSGLTNKMAITNSIVLGNTATAEKAFNDWTVLWSTSTVNNGNSSGRLLNSVIGSVKVLGVKGSGIVTDGVQCYNPLYDLSGSSVIGEVYNLSGSADGTTDVTITSSAAYLVNNAKLTNSEYTVAEMVAEVFGSKIMLNRDGRTLQTLNSDLVLGGVKTAVQKFNTVSGGYYVSTSFFDGAKWVKVADGKTEGDANINDTAKYQILDVDQNGKSREVTVNGTAYQVRGAMSGLADDTPLVVETLEGGFDAYDGKTSLREAIDYANENGGGTITFSNAIDWLGTGSFGSGATITLAPEFGALEIKSNITIESKLDFGTVDQGYVTISGGDATQIFTITADAGLTLSNITLTNGFAADTNGGAIYNAGTLTMTGSTISNSKVVARSSGVGVNGGAIYNELGATLTLTDTDFISNSSVKELDSAGLAKGGAIHNAGTMTITGGVFDGNSAQIDGGAINAGPSATISGVTIRNTLSSNGIYVNNGTVVITDSTFTGNAEKNVVQAAGGANVLIEGSLFTGNSVGSVSNSSSTVTIVNSVFVGNTIGGNQGIIATSQGGKTLILNSTVAGNTGAGHGIYAMTSSSKVDIYNSVITDRIKILDSTPVNLYSTVYALADGDGLTADTNSIQVVASDADGSVLMQVFGKDTVTAETALLPKLENALYGGIQFKVEGTDLKYHNGTEWLPIQSNTLVTDAQAGTDYNGADRRGVEGVYTMGAYNGTGLIVTTNSDNAEDGNTLREAIAFAVSIGGGKITFAAGKDWESMGTITLSTSIAFSEDLVGDITIDGSYTKADGSAGRINIVNAAKKNIYLFQFTDTATASASSFTLKNLTFNGLNFTASAAGVVAYADVAGELNNVEIRNGKMSTGLINGNDGAFAGWIFTKGSRSLTIKDTVIAENTVTLQRTVNCGVFISVKNSGQSTLDHLIFEKNETTSSSSLTTEAILIKSTYAKITGGSKFIGNSILRSGGATDGSVTLLTINAAGAKVEDSLFQDNTAITATVKAILQCTFQNCEFIGNTGKNGGGAMSIAFSSATVFYTISDCLFDGNTGKNGGAIMSEGHLRLSDSAFIGNTTSGSGGAIYLSHSRGSYIANSTFYGNTAGGNGGAVYTTGNATVSYGSVTIAGNYAGGSGGGIYSNASGNAVLGVANSIILGNTSGGTKDTTTGVVTGAIDDDISVFQSGTADSTSLRFGAGRSVIGTVTHLGYTDIVDGATVRNPLRDLEGNIIAQVRNVEYAADGDSASAAAVYRAGNVISNATYTIHDTFDDGGNLTGRGLISQIFGSAIKVNEDGRTLRTYLVEGLTTGGVEVTVNAGQGNTDARTGLAYQSGMTEGVDPKPVYVAIGIPSISNTATSNNYTTDGFIVAFTAENDQMGKSREFTILKDSVATTYYAKGASSGLLINPLVVETLDDTIDPYDYKTSLREAIIYANQEGGDQTITFSNATDWLGTGTFGSGAELTLNPALGAMNVTANITIDGALVYGNGIDQGTLAITGGDAVQIFTIAAGGGMTISNMRLINGNAGEGNGGAINNAGTLSLTNVNVSNSKAANGGAIYSTGSLTVNGGTFYGNSVDGSNNSTGNGGAIYSTGTATISSAVFDSNSAEYNGGAIYNGGTLTIAGSVFSGHSAQNGVVFNQGNLLISGGTYTGNTANVLGAWGGTALIANAEIFGNTAADTININGDGSVIIIGSTIADNGTNVINAVSGSANVYNSILEGASAGTVNLYSSVYTSTTATADTNSILVTESAEAGSVLKQIFGKEELAMSGGLLPVLDKALTGGIQFQVDGSDNLQYHNGTEWITIQANTLLTDAEAGRDITGANRRGAGLYTMGAYDASGLIVTTSADTVDPDDGKNSLREAIAFAVSLGGGTITFSKNVDWGTEGTTIKVTSTFNITAGMTGTLTIDGSLKYVDANGVETDYGRMTLDGGNTVTVADDGKITFSNKGKRIFKVTTAGTFALNDLILQNAYHKGSSDADSGGAVVWQSGGSFNMDNCYLVHNTAVIGNNVGGAAVRFQNVKFHISNSKFEGNGFSSTTSNAAGGALFINGCTSTENTITNTDFLKNYANAAGNGKGGGAIAIRGASVVTITGGEFTENYASRSSGGYGGEAGVIWLEGKKSKLVIDGATFSRNHADYAGGAIKMENETILEVRNSTFTENYSVKGNGGAIAQPQAGTATITNSYFSKNEAIHGGAVFNNSGIITILNNVFTYNKATGVNGAGGAVRIGNANGNNPNESRTEDGAWIANSTFYGNSAAYGGAIANASAGTGNHPYFHNLTIVGNTATKKGGGFFAQHYATTSNTITNSIILGNTVGTDADDVCMVQDKANNGNHKFTITNSVIGVFRHGGFGTIDNGYSYSAKHTQHVTLNGTVYLKELWGIRAAVDAEGNPVQTPVLDAEGNPVLDTEGNPTYKQVYEPYAMTIAKQLTDADYNKIFVGNGGEGYKIYLADDGKSVLLRHAGKDILANVVTPRKDTDQLGEAWTQYGGKYLVGAVGKLADNLSLVVTTDQDVVDAYDGLISLREAIATANANGGGTITFSRDVDWSTTDKTVTLDGTDAEGNLLGALMIRSLKEDNSGYNPITIDGSLMYGTMDCGTITVKVPVTYGEAKAADDLSTASDFRVITSSSSLTLQNMTIMGGYLASAAGGAIDHTASIGSKGNSTHLTLDHVTIADSGAKSGGALSCGTNTLTIKNSVFRNNYASQNGGAINRTSRALTLEDVTFTGNTAGSSGGAIHVWQSGLTLKGDCLFENNSAGDNGGAILVNSTNNASSLTTTAPADGSEIIFRGNTAGDNGGALWVSGPLTLNGGVTFENNTATGNGGAIYNKGALTASNATFIGNTATGNGGAIYLASGTADVINSTFCNNVGNTGSSIYLADGTFHLINSTLFSTSANSSVEIAAGTFNAINSIVCGTVNGSLNNFRSMVGADAADIFTSTTLTADNTLEIKADSAAAYAGALVGQLDGAYYYAVDGYWYSLDGTKGNALTSDAATGYGLGNTATIYTTAQNTDTNGDPVSRVLTTLAFNAGAHALGTVETPSLVVNAALDAFNPFDGKTTLREAIAEAQRNGGTVTFDQAAIAASGARTVTVGSDTYYVIDILKTANSTNNGSAFILTNNLAIDGGTNKIMLDISKSNGTSMQVGRYFEVGKKTLSLTIRNLVIRGSGSDADGNLDLSDATKRNVSGAFYYGGPNMNSDYVFDHVTLERFNTSGKGVIDLHAWHKTYHFIDSTIQDNVSATYLIRMQSSSYTAKFQGVTIQRNTTGTLYDGSITINFSANADGDRNLFKDNIFSGSMFTAYISVSDTDIMGNTASGIAAGFNKNSFTLKDSTVTDNTFSGTLLGAKGSARWGHYGTVTVEDTVFTGNTFNGKLFEITRDTQDGYESRFGVVNMNNVTFANNTMTATSPLLNSNGEITINNLTFYNNTVAGDLFRINDGTLTLTNSTIAGNTSASAAKIHVVNVLSGTVTLLNNILVGNNGTNGTSAVTVADGATVNAFYNVYDSADATLNSTNTVGTMADVLGTTPAFDGKTVAIAPAGAAAINGTLVGKIGSDVYYVADGSWFKVGSDTAAATFDAANTNNDNYGLGTATGTSVYTTAQNGMDRLAVADLGFFNVGAYAFDPAMVETASTVVDLAEDVVNPFDGKISLREAIAYAGTGSLGNEITFADAVTAVTLTQLLAVSKNITITDNDVTVNGNLSVASGSSLTVSSGSKVTLGTVSNSGTVDNKGSLTLAALEGAGNLTNSGTLDVNGNFAGGTVDNTGTMSLAGETNSGTGTLGNVTYDGTDGQNMIAADTYGNLVISTTGTATVAGDIKATSTTVNSGATLDVNGDFAGGTLTNNGSLNLAGVNNTATGTLGNVTYDGTTQQVITGTYGDLTISSTGTATANGDVTATTTKVNSGATLDVNGNFAGGTVNNTGSMILAGETNSGTGTLGDVTYDGTANQQIIASETYSDLVISTTGTATVNGNLKAETTTNSATLDVNGNFAGGTVNNSGSMTLSGATNSGTGTLGDVTYDGTDQQVIAGTYDDLVISSTGKATVDGDITATTTTNSATLDVNGNFAGGAVTNTGSMTLAGETNSGTGTLGNVTYDGADQQVIAGTYGDLTINSTGKATATGDLSAATVDNNANTEVTGNLTTTGALESAAALKVGGSVESANITTTGEMEVANNLTASGTVDSDTALTVGGNFSAATTDNSSDLKVSGNYTADTTTTSGTLDVDGNFSGGDVTNTGTMTLSGANNSANAGSTLGDVTYNGTADQEVIAGTYEDLVISTTGTATATGDISAATVKSDAETAITGNLTATGNITSNGNMDVTGNLTATGDLASTAALTVGGDATANNATLSGETTITGDLTATGTVDSDAALTVGGNLTADTADNSSDLTVGGNFSATTTNNSGTLDAAGDLNAGSLTNSGSISVAGAFATTSTDLGAVEYDGTAAQNVVEGTYSDLSLTGGDKSLAGAVTVTDSLTADANIDTAGQDLTLSGDVAGSGTISTTTDSGTVTYDGADQNVLAGAYNNLALTNGTKTLNSTASTTVNDTFSATGTTIQSDTADVLASLTVKDAGNDSTPSSAIAGTTFNGIALNNTGSADGYLYVNADTNNADDATTGVYLVGDVFVTASGIIYGDTLGKVYITVTNGNGDVISEGTADDLGWTWAVGNDAIENATTGTAYELVSKEGYKFRFHGDVNVVIGKRAITVKADDLAIDTGDDPVFTYTYIGELVDSDAFTGELASEGDGSQPGDFAITQGTLSLGDNYDLTFIGGTLTVEGGGQDAHQFPSYNNPGNFAGVYDAPVHSTTHSYDHHESVPTLEHQNDRSIGFLFSVSNKQLGDASGAFGESAPQGSSVNIHAHTLSDLLKSYDKSEQIIASPANEIEDAKDDMKDLHDFSNNPFGILPDDEDLHTRAYDESIDFTVIGEDNLSTAKAEQFKDEFDAALEELLTLA